MYLETQLLHPHMMLTTTLCFITTKYNSCSQNMEVCLFSLSQIMDFPKLTHYSFKHIMK